MSCQLKRPQLGLLAVALTLALTAAGGGGPAAAQTASRKPSAPLMMVVSLSRQKVTVYDARGKMLEAPVSTGRSGYETPAGLYSVIERKRHHFSNLYESAPMPFMQRITWSGIALHAGPLPGYPASHGCVRLPYDFAGQLFQLSRRGARVVVMRDDMAPVDFAHPALFRPADPRVSLDEPDARLEKATFAPQATRRSIAEAKAAAAEAAADRARAARRVLGRAREEAGEYLDALEIAENVKGAALATIREAEALLRMEHSPKDGERLKAAKAKAEVDLSLAQEQIDAVHAAAKAKIDAVVAARAVARAAKEASDAAEEEAKLAALAPVSVFVSRKAQRLYVRHAFEPLFESDVTIGAPEVPIGTTLFTAIGYAGKDTDELQWNALTMYPGPVRARPGSGPPPRQGEPARTDAAAAKAALERIAIPQEALDRINELIVPGSSLIVSDEELSRETMKGTDFIVVMSGEPQGGIRRRSLRRYLYSSYDRGYDLPPPPSTGFAPFSLW
jgi:hypothetical protein